MTPEAQIAKARPSTDDAPVPPRVVIFVAFDLVNSTKYKTEDLKGWPAQIAAFYTAVDHARHARAPSGLDTWKYAGDEVILQGRISGMADAAPVVRWAQAEVLTLIEGLSKTRCEQSDVTPLSVKATAWVALVTDLANDADEFHLANVEFRPNGSGAKDYLGPEIDIGFRISQFAVRSLLCVSIELALLLAGDENVRLAGHQPLKGVWRGAPYPILLYANDWAKAREHIPYRDEFSNDWLTKVLLASRRVGQLRAHLERALRDVGGFARWEALRDLLQTGKSAEERVGAADPSHEHSLAVSPSEIARSREPDIPPAPSSLGPGVRPRKAPAK